MSSCIHNQSIATELDQVRALAVATIVNKCHTDLEHRHWSTGVHFWSRGHREQLDCFQARHHFVKQVRAGIRDVVVLAGVRGQVEQAKLLIAKFGVGGLARPPVVALSVNELVHATCATCTQNHIMRSMQATQAIKHHPRFIAIVVGGWGWQASLSRTASHYTISQVGRTKQSTT